MSEKQQATQAKNKINIKKTDVKKFIILTLGSLIYASGVSLFLDPNNLAPGGLSGLAIIIHELVPLVKTGTWIIMFNIPILALGIYKFGFKFFFSTIYATLLSSFAMNIMDEHIGVVTEEPMLAVIIGMALLTVGISMVFIAGGTTGGTDVIVKLLRLKFRHLDTGTVFIMLDAVIIALSGVVFGNIEVVLYASIGLAVQTVVMNRVLYGSDEARMVYIISKNKEKISSRILTDMERGATYIRAAGAYTMRENDILMCVVSMKELPKVRDIVKEEDSEAFLIVTSATSVFGDGFKDHNSEEL